MNLNKRAYDLVQKLSFSEIKPNLNIEPLTGSLGERGAVDLSDKIVPNQGISRGIDYANRTINIYGFIIGFEVGFDENEYPHFQEFIVDIQREHFEDLASFNFIEEKALDWFLFIFEHKRSSNDILPFLEEQVRANMKSHTFYFPVNNMNIETPFTLGNTRFCYFTKEEMDNYYKNLKSKENSTWTDEVFDGIYRSKFQGVVLAQVTVDSERSRAEDLAKEIASISVDILKFHTNNLTVPDFKVPFDLNFRLNYQRKSVFLTGNGLKDPDLAYNVQFNTNDYSWTDERLTFAYNQSMGLFSEFIILRKKDELYLLIIQAIKNYASALANWDLHERCVSLITIIESLLLKFEEMYKMELKVKQRIVKIGSSNDQEDVELNGHLSNIYQVRHKMVHKAVRLNINHVDLGKTQTMILVLLMKLIYLNHQFSKKEAVLDYLDSVERVA